MLCKTNNMELLSNDKNYFKHLKIYKHEEMYSSK